MRILRGLLAFIITLMVFAMVVIYPFALAVNNNFLSYDFYTEDLETSGTYDVAYDALMRQAEAQINTAVEADPNMDEEIADWVNASVKSVLTRDYVVDLLKKNAAGTMGYLSGQAETLPVFDLEPKYDELRAVMADGLTLEMVMKISGLSVDNVTEAVLITLGVVDAEGNINSVLANQAMRAVFDSNEALKEPFMMKSVVDVMAYTGNQEAEKDLETAKKWVTLFHKGILPMLLILSFLSTLQILMHLGRLRTAFRLNGWAYTLGAAVVMVAGGALSRSKGLVFEKVQALMEKALGGLTGVLPLEVLQPFGKEVASKGLIFLGIGVLFLLLAGLFSRRRKAKNAAATV